MAGGLGALDSYNVWDVPPPIKDNVVRVLGLGVHGIHSRFLGGKCPDSEECEEEIA